MDVDPTSLRIVRYPDPVLRRRAEDVDPADESVRAVARRMIELMHEADGVGLAAPQVGLPWRLFVTNAGDADPVDRVLMNPVLTLTSPDEAPSPLETMEEGCLSLPGIHAEVRRPRHAAIEATGLEGEAVSMAAEGFLARVWQHEFDHLEGVLIIDRMGPKDRMVNRRSIRDLELSFPG
jgi:peptide deformylase